MSKLAFALAFSAALLLVHRPLLADESTLRIGVAEVEITPPEGFPMAGYYHERLATGTHDPLKARAIVFREGDEAAALVACDLTGIAADLTAEVRRRVAQRTGLAARNVVLTATHSHTAPDYTRNLYEHLGSGGENTAISPYAEQLISGIAEAIVRAHDGVQPATLDIGTARQEVPVAFNRRFVMRDGSVKTWARLDDPQVVRPAGPIDPEVGIVLVRAADDGSPLGVLTNFALHLDTVGGTQWSADYPYYIEQALRKRLGADVVSIFGLGCCGDINHVDPARRERNSTEFIGRSLAATIESALPKLSRAEQPRLNIRSAEVLLPLQEVSRAEIARAPDLLKAAKAGTRVEFFDLVGAHKAVMLEQFRSRRPMIRAADHISWGLSHSLAGTGEHLPVEVHTLCFGNELAIVCLPGEVFVELGLAIKQASPFETTLVIELSNCVETAYVPTRVAYAGGGYEAANSTLQPGAGEMLAEAAVRLLRETASAENNSPAQ